MEGLVAWLRDPYFHEIVLAKNCAIPVDAIALRMAAEAHGKRLEFVQVEGSPLTERRGKGFGEGDMIREVLQKSEVLRGAAGFCKATGKLYLRDAAAFYGSPGGGVFFKTAAPACGALVFWRGLICGMYRSKRFHRVLPWLHRRVGIPWSLVAAAPREWIDTRFYKVSREGYERRFADSYERVDDALGYSLEAAFADDAEGCADCTFVMEAPIVYGYSGTLGTAAAEFSEEIRREAGELTARIL